MVGLRVVARTPDPADFGSIGLPGSMDFRAVTSTGARLVFSCVVGLRQGLGPGVVSGSAGASSQDGTAFDLVFFLVFCVAGALTRRAVPLLLSYWVRSVNHTLSRFARVTDQLLALARAL